MEHWDYSRAPGHGPAVARAAASSGIPRPLASPGGPGVSTQRCDRRDARIEGGACSSQPADIELVEAARRLVRTFTFR